MLGWAEGNIGKTETFFKIETYVVIPHFLLLFRGAGSVHSVPFPS